jgi:dTDP-4-amino-4,6-dideoxygalactose transaminase
MVSVRCTCSSFARRSTRDEVIVPSNTYIATGQATHAGATPSRRSLTPATFNIDPALIEVITSNLGHP